MPPVRNRPPDIGSNTARPTHPTFPDIAAGNTRVLTNPIPCSASFPRSGVGTHFGTLPRPFNRGASRCFPDGSPGIRSRQRLRRTRSSAQDAGASSRRSHAGAWEQEEREERVGASKPRKTVGWSPYWHDCRRCETGRRTSEAIPFDPPTLHFPTSQPEIPAC